MAPDNQVKIVKVGEGNVHELVGMLRELAHFESLDPPSLEAEKGLLRDIGSDPPPFLAYLATVNGKTVGCVTVFFTYSTFLAKPTLFMEDLFVLTDFRKTGVGSKLFAFCVQEAERRGCGRMEWNVLNWNSQAIDFYQRRRGVPVSGMVPYRLDEEHFDLI